MKKFLVMVFIVHACSGMAQSNQTPTRFDKFINDPKIQWATYASDTFDFDDANLNNLLLSRLQQKKIRAGLPVISRTEAVNKVNYVSYDSIFSSYFRERNPVIPVLDEQGEVIEYVQEVPKIDTSGFRLTEVTQLVYVEKGMLKSYIPWVTPTLPLYTSSGKYIGESFFFNTAYNFKRQPKNRKHHKIIALGQTKKLIDLGDRHNLLKEMYGKNLVETLWPAVLDNQIRLYSLPGNIPVKPEAWEKAQRVSTTLIVPIFDSVNQVLRYDTFQTKLNPGAVTKIVLVQDWYYNQTRNFVFNKINALLLYPPEQPGEKEANKSPAFRLVPEQ